MAAGGRTWRPGPPLAGSADHAVALRASGGRISCDLSGGLDSTTLAAIAARHGTVDAVTVHPEGTTDGADLAHARAAVDRARFRHHLIPLTAAHAPYSRLSAVPAATDEPAPSTLTPARLLAQMQWMRAELGTTDHLTGDGGDSLLFVPPIHLADLWRHRHRGRATAETAGWARLRAAPPGPILAAAVRAARTTRRQALTDYASAAADRRTLAAPHGVGWLPVLPVPSWAPHVAVTRLADAAHAAAARPDPFTGLDAAVRTLVDEVREVARTAAADNQLTTAAAGVALHNPFLDPLVLHAVLTTPIGRRPPVHVYKPVLRAAFTDVLTLALAARQTKGAYEADHFTGMRAHITGLVAVGRLADLGIIEPARFRVAVRQAAAGVPGPLATIEQASAAEAWLTALEHHPAPAVRGPGLPAYGVCVGGIRGGRSATRRVRHRPCRPRGRRGRASA